jgi:ABC-type polysaccharide/polyol phosphate export permease
MSAPDAGHGHGHGSVWSKIWPILLAMALGGIAFSMLMNALSDSAAYAGQRKAGWEFILWLFKTIGIYILSAAAIGLAIKNFVASKGDHH